LYEPEDVAIRISYEKLISVGHASKRNREFSTDGLKTSGKSLRILNAEADVQVLCRLKSGLISLMVHRALQVDAAAVAGDARVEAFVAKVDLKAKPFTVVSDRSRQICYPQYWSDINKGSGAIPDHVASNRVARSNSIRSRPVRLDYRH
jgi:hypothetical protein